MTDCVQRLRADPHIGEFVKDTNAKELQTQPTHPLCVLSGGPCAFEGGTMKDAQRT